VTVPGLPLLTPRQMEAADRHAIDGLGVPGLALMESAAGACVHALLERWGRPSRVVVLAGPGNNGGDGLAIARRLVGLGVAAEAWLPLGRAKAGADCRAQLAMAEAAGVPIHEGPPSLSSAEDSVIVDALFGTGLARPVDGPLAGLVTAASAHRVLAVDIPSGVSGATGVVLGAAVRADITVTFGSLKIGHVTEPGRARAGDLVLADIGIPVHQPDAPRLLDARCLAPVRDEGSASAHKGTYGHLLVLAGGPGKVGAARLTSEAALRAGAGLVTLAIPADVPVDSLATLAPEVMVERLPGRSGAFSLDSLEPALALASTRRAVALGPGIGTDPATVDFVRAFLGACGTPSVVDADGLNAMVGASWPAAGTRVVTPHPGEAARLLDQPTTAVQTDRLAAARDLARATDSVAVLKGAGTVIAAPSGAWNNPSGNPAMGTAGSGDVLTGVVGAFLARGLPAEIAATAGVHLHGLAGDRAAVSVGRGLVASDISRALGPVLAAPPPDPPHAPWLTVWPAAWRP